MRLESGRKYLWQWELEQRLIVDVECEVVHFSNGTTKEALSCEVFEEAGKRLVNVPNILLQTAADLRCYAWDGTTVVAFTTFHVEARAKPAEYVYTETEVRRYDLLLEELEKKGAYYTPAVDAEGNLSWEKSLERMPDVPGGNIRGPKGEQGPQGPQGDPGEVNVDDDAVGGDAWSSKNTVDKLCPAFEESGSVVVCEPVEGYPLEVTASADATQIIRCGKNILNVATAGVYHNNPAKYWCDNYVTETGLRLESLTASTESFAASGFYLGTAKELAGKTITVSGKVETTTSVVPKPFVRATSTEPTSIRNNPTYNDGGYFGSNSKSLKEGKTENGYGTVTYTVTGEEEYPYIAVLFQFTYGGSYEAGDWTEWSDIQVEIGNTATAYEPYRGETFAPNEKITALQGVNTLYADSGEITVSGKADPVAIIEKQETIIAEQETELAKLNKQYELIEEITLEEDVASVTRTADTNGVVYNFSAVRIWVSTPAAPSADITFILDSAGTNYWMYHNQQNVAGKDAARTTAFIIRNDCGQVDYSCVTSPNSYAGNVIARGNYSIRSWKNITKITLNTSTSIPAGTKIKIWGIGG